MACSSVRRLERAGKDGWVHDRNVQRYAAEVDLREFPLWNLSSTLNSARRAFTYSNLDGFSMNGMSTSSDRLH